MTKKVITVLLVIFALVLINFVFVQFNIGQPCIVLPDIGMNCDEEHSLALVKYIVIVFSIFTILATRHYTFSKK
jgi:hypothetical protein